MANVEMLSKILAVGLSFLAFISINCLIATLCPIKTKLSVINFIIKILLYAGPIGAPWLLLSYGPHKGEYYLLTFFVYLNIMIFGSPLVTIAFVLIQRYNKSSIGYDVGKKNI